MAKFILNWQELLKYRKQALALSLLVLLIGVGAIIWQGGLQYGIDFTGGLRLMFEFSRPLESEDMAVVRGLFQKRLEGARVNTFELDSAEENSGLMVTVRGHQLVEDLTRELVAAGEAGETAESFERLASEYLVTGAILEDNFRFGSGPPEKVNLVTADAVDVGNRVQTIVNETISDQVVELLHGEFIEEELPIDLNWAGEAEIQNWLIEAQLQGFIEEFEYLREQSTEEFDGMHLLGPLLNQFDIPRGEFESIFTFDSDEVGLLELTQISTDNLREIIHEEFFLGRYGSVAREIINLREEKNIFTDFSELLEISSVQQLYRPPLEESFGVSPFVLLSGEMVSPAIGADLITLALMAILISFGGVLAYLYIRFELTYSLSAITAIVHDVIITVGILTIIGVEFDVPVVAAVLTVIGYSLNDTIVNFDRIRENKVLMGYRANWYEVINRSIYEVLNRTLVTSVTTFLAVFILYLYGGVALHAFSITLLIGIVAGTYSSIFVSNATLLKLKLSLREL